MSSKVSVDQEMVEMAAAFLLGMSNNKDIKQFQSMYERAESVGECNWQNILEVIQSGHTIFKLAAPIANTLMWIFHELRHQMDHDHPLNQEVMSDERMQLSCTEFSRTMAADLVEAVAKLLEHPVPQDDDEEEEEEDYAEFRLIQIEFTDSKGRPLGRFRQ